MEISQYIDALEGFELETVATFDRVASETSPSGWDDRLFYTLAPLPEGVEEITLTVERAELHPNKDEAVYAPSLLYTVSVFYEEVVGPRAVQMVTGYYPDPQHLTGDALTDAVYSAGRFGRLPEVEALAVRISQTFEALRAEERAEAVAEMVEWARDMGEELTEEEAGAAWDARNSVIEDVA